MLKSWTRNSNDTYGPTDNGRFYLPKPDHNKNSRNSEKHKWAISANQEISVFMIAESPSKKGDVELYCHENNCYFSVVDNCKFELGMNHERLAKFPKPQNLTDAWHGYPVLCDKVWNLPSDDLLDIMVKQKVISETTRNRIERKKF